MTIRCKECITCCALNSYFIMDYFDMSFHTLFCCVYVLTYVTSVLSFVYMLFSLVILQTGNSFELWIAQITLIVFSFCFDIFYLYLAMSCKIMWFQFIIAEIFVTNMTFRKMIAFLWSSLLRIISASGFQCSLRWTISIFFKFFITRKWRFL